MTFVVLALFGSTLGGIAPVGIGTCTPTYVVPQPAAAVPKIVERARSIIFGETVTVSQAVRQD